jgi:hypothetical protein
MSIKNLLAALFSMLGAMWPTLLASTFLSLVLLVPPQTHELYRILMQGDDWLRAVGTLLILALSSCVIILMGRALLLTIKPHAFTAGGWERFLAESLPVISGAVIPFVAGFGMFAAARDIPTISLPDSATARSASLSEIARLTEEAANTATGLRVAGWVLIGTALVLLMVARSLTGRQRKLVKTISDHGPGIWIAAIGAELALSILFAVFNGLAASLGTIAVVSLFGVVLVAVLTGLQINFYRSGWSLLALACVAAFAFSFFGWNDNHVIHEKPLKNPQAIFDAAGPQLAFESWYRSRKDLGHFTKTQRYPVFIVAARGGGIYAAAQDAIFLSRMQDQCSNFSQHVFAISGVSGGSLGAALFSSLAREDVPNGAWQPCRFGKSDTGVFEQRARSFLKTDFLAPIVAAALFPDLLQRFFPIPIPGSDRGEALSRGLERAWQETEPNAENPFEQTFLSHWNPNSAAPALMFNTTEVDNGRRVVIAPFAVSPLRDSALSQLSWFYQTDEMDKSLLSGLPGPSVKADVKLSEAAGMSARFPWILPAATIKRGGRSIRLVDGGYFDNSGIETALDLIEILINVRQEHQEHPADAEGHPDPFDFDIHLITISGSVEDGSAGWQGLDDLLSPVLALLSSREARGTLSATKAQTGRFFYPAGTPTFDTRPAATLDEQDMALALGFQLSNNSIALIGAQAGEANQSGRILGPASIQEAEGRDSRITPNQRRIMLYAHGNSYTACRMKYWLQGQDVPGGDYPCDAGASGGQ